jgi:signal transduction histidine kinase
MNATSSGTPGTPGFSSPAGSSRWQRFSSAAVRGFHAYGSWLVSISWRSFILLALALIIMVAIVHDFFNFSWSSNEVVEVRAPRVVVVPQPPREARTPQPPARPTVEVTQNPGEMQIRIGERVIRIASQPAAAASAAASAGGAASVEINLPAGEIGAVLRELEQAARDAAQAARDAEQATRDAQEARRDAAAALAELGGESGQPQVRVRRTHLDLGDGLMQLTLLWVFASAVLKSTYKGRLQAEVKAAQATETAEAESLKRQVVEARMAAMQAQVEPHFLFNTLASIDHLIETDPPRASQMQKNLIALLRASMPTMREANGEGSQGVRDLGRELAVIRPYLEILKVRMEERLATEVQVPEGLLSAEFPPMMIQTLVENAIKHGLEPKAEGGTLKLKAEIVHGKLQVVVADTGLGFGKAATAGTGVGLANIRERLQLLYGPKASLTVAENQPSGTVVTITVPYKTVEGSFA